MAGVQEQAPSLVACAQTLESLFGSWKTLRFYPELLWLLSSTDGCESSLTD